MKHGFLTEAFYLEPYRTVTVLNEIIESEDNLVADKDMYSNGCFLFLEAFDNAKTREILSVLICDFDKYILFNNNIYPSDEDSEIGLCALQDIHTKFFGIKEEIMWDSEMERFEARCVIES